MAEPRSHQATPPDPVAVLRLVAGDPPTCYTRRERREAAAIMLGLGVPRRMVAQRLRISLAAGRKLCHRVEHDGVWGHLRRATQ